MGVHPGENPIHQVSLICDDPDATIAELSAKGVHLEGEPKDEGFGITITMLLPGGTKMMLYQVRHNTAF
jgi:hypothetical protein